jgi:cardiolipin synthase A/B
MKLLIQPGDGVEKLIKGISKAKKSVEIVVFRFDRSEIERALMEAVERGVFVHALIAFTNRGGEENLRKLEMRFLERGISVARTAGDLVRYHSKMILVDRKELYLLAFNFTRLDIDHSRSFGLMTRNPKLVQEAGRLFDADSNRQDYTPGYSKFVVSPRNARKALTSFIKGAKKELLIYDPKISDRAMLRLLEERRAAGVDIRIIGHVARGRVPPRVRVRALNRMHLHTRTIIRDRRQAFIGSQSLRQLELDARREVGVIFRDHSAIASLLRIFKEDWVASEAESGTQARAAQLSVDKAGKKLAKVVSQSLSAGAVVKQVVKAVGNKKRQKLNGRQVEETVKKAVKQAVKTTVKEAANDAVEALASEAPETIEAPARYSQSACKR